MATIDTTNTEFYENKFLVYFIYTSIRIRTNTFFLLKRFQIRNFGYSNPYKYVRLTGFN